MSSESQVKSLLLEAIKAMKSQNISNKSEETKQNDEFKKLLGCRSNV